MINDDRKMNYLKINKCAEIFLGNNKNEIFNKKAVSCIFVSAIYCTSFYLIILRKYNAFVLISRNRKVRNSPVINKER